MAYSGLFASCWRERMGIKMMDVEFYLQSQLSFSILKSIVVTTFEIVSASSITILKLFPDDVMPSIA